MRVKIIKALVLITLLTIILSFIFLPSYIDAKLNKVTFKNPVLPPADYNVLPFVADLHCDMLLWNRDFLSPNNYGHVDLPRMQSANMALQVFTIVSKTPRGLNMMRNTDASDQVSLLSFVQLRSPRSWFSLKARALNQIDDLHQFASHSQGEFRIIKSKNELRKFMADRKENRKLVAGMIGLEGAHCLESEIENLNAFFEGGVRYIGLAHFFDNEWSGSAHGVQQGGLTPLGKLLLKKMDSLNIIVDLAHASPKAIDDILKSSTKPLLVSHTGVCGICDNPRNLSDGQIEAIGSRDGLIGIGLWATAVCGSDAAATARSMKYVADKIGTDKVCLGSDFDGAVTTHFDVTGLPLVMKELQMLGFDEVEIEMMMGGNIRDFFMRNLPE